MYAESQFDILVSVIPAEGDAVNTGSVSVNDVRYLPSISTVNVSPSFLVYVITPLVLLKVAPVVYSSLYSVK